jgi:PHP family Zn ribbon phosphoesterase
MKKETSCTKHGHNFALIGAENHKMFCTKCGEIRKV